MNIEPGHASYKGRNIFYLYPVLTPGDEKIKKQPPEFAELMLFLRRHILAFNPGISETFKYMTLFYEFKGHGICYMHLKEDYVYLGFTGITHPKLVSEGRKSVRIFKCYVNRDVDVKSLDAILAKACALADKKNQRTRRP